MEYLIKPRESFPTVNGVAKASFSLNFPGKVTFRAQNGLALSGILTLTVIEPVIPTRTPSPTTSPAILPSSTLSSTPSSLLANLTNTPSPVPTPLIPTFTPIPTTFQRIRGQVIENLVEVLLYMLSLIGGGIAGLFTIYKAYTKRQDAIMDAESKLKKATGEEKEELERKITRLQAIKWWQFWR